MKVDLYDFDKTIIPFDSGTKYIIFCMLHYPWCIIALPRIAVGFLLYKLHIIRFDKMKSNCFTFQYLVPKNAVKRFWDKYEKTAHPWFFERERYGIVISASPDFLLNEISERLGFDELICTKHKKSGKMITNNCRNAEKVKRLFEEHNKNEIEIIDVYSDSYKADKPIFSLATNQCYHIENGKRVAFDFNKIYGE